MLTLGVTTPGDVAVLMPAILGLAMPRLFRTADR
jgi:hypothetical protein